MPQLMDDVSRQLSGGVVDRISREIGADGATTERAIATALPLLLGSLARNAQRRDGARDLNRALREDHDGSLLDGLVDGLTETSTQADGAKILGHMFGQREPAVRNGVGRASGLDSGQVLRLLSMLAPIVMSVIGRMRRQDDLGPDDLSTRLGSERDAMVRKDASLGGLLTGMLDGDGDGSVMDDIGGRLLEGFLRSR